MAPVPLGLLGGGSGNSPGGRPPGVERSSGAPIWRPPAPASEIGGGGSLAAVLVPSARGAPGAFGLAEGSKASPRRTPPGNGLSIADDDTCDETGAGLVGGGE